jgi:hypothetical protein
MEQLKEWLENHNYFIGYDDIIYDNGNITHIYFKDDLLIYCAIAPHSGNHYKYLLRVDTPKTFDRWGVCLAQYEYQSAEDIANELLENSEMIYKDVLAAVLEECGDPT